MQDTYQKLTQDVITYLKSLKGPLPASYLAKELSPLIAKKPAAVALQETKKPALQEPPLQKAPVQKPDESKAVAPQAAPPKKAEAPPKKEPLPKVKKHPSFDVKIEPPKKAQRDSLEDVKKALEKIAPSLYLNFNVPKDDQAKLIKRSYQINESMPDVPILSFSQKTLPFLQGIAEAIDRHFFPSKVIDTAKIKSEEMFDELILRDHLKLIIAIDTTFFSHKALMKHYQEFPAKKERFLGKTPLLLLPDPMIYMQDPTLKRSLWNLLCDQLMPLQNKP